MRQSRVTLSIHSSVLIAHDSVLIAQYLLLVFSSASSGVRPRLASAPETPNPAATIQTLRRRALPSSLSNALTGNAHIDRNGVSTGRVLARVGRSEHRSLRGCRTLATG